MLTIDDIRNSTRKSGFDNVNSASRGENARISSRRRPLVLWRAEGPAGSAPNTARGKWRGPSRHTAEEAARDYCDYVNGSFLKPLISNFTPPTIDMGTTTHTKAASTVVVQRQKYEGPHDVYDVLFYDGPSGLVFRRKVGKTARGESRYADIAKTFGFSIKPYARAVTYSNEKAAKAAEDLKIASVQKEAGWEQCGKESFRPVGPNEGMKV